MLKSGSCLKNFPVLSLQMGFPIARLESEIIDPNSLKILGFNLSGPEVGGENGVILDVRDIREFSPLGLIIDSSDSFINPGDVVKLDKILELNFSLVGLKVKTKKGTKLGVVSDYTFDLETFSVQQIVVRRPFLKSFDTPELVISRKEIVSVNDYEIIIKDEEKKLQEKARKEDFVPNFVNPFREPDFAPSPMDREGN